MSVSLVWSQGIVVKCTAAKYGGFIHVFLSSTQFSSDQIQNGGVNSEGRTIAILACACANDVPVEFTLVWGTLLFTLEDIWTS